MALRWSSEWVAYAQSVLRATPRDEFDDALARLGCTYEQIKGAFRREGVPPPFSHCCESRFMNRERPTIGHAVAEDPPRERQAAREERATDPAPAPDRFARLVDACRRGPVPLRDLCDALDLSPTRCEAIVREAQAAGYHIDVAHGEVAWKLPDTTGTVVDVAVPPTRGPRQMIGVVSDLHFGSKHCLRAQLREFIGQAYEKGVRYIASPGD